jgi:hypothetical protein
MNPFARDRKEKYEHSFAHNFTAVHPTTQQTTCFGLTLVITRSDKTECATFVQTALDLEIPMFFFYVRLCEIVRN